jgi:tetratricopeptide (TPR) repeat protein
MLNKSQVIKYLDNDISMLKSHLTKAKAINSKKIILEKLIHVQIKKIAITSSCPYIENTYNILKNENSSDAVKALLYLRTKYTLIKRSNLANYHMVMALTYEVVGKVDSAAKEYKSALKLGFNRESLTIYREFVDRTREKEETQKSEVVTNIDIEGLCKSAKSLESIAKKYTKSYKSLELAQKYYNYALDAYKQLMQTHISKYTQEYILALIKGVETYNLPKELLKEAESLLFFYRDSQSTQDYLLNKIKVLKGVN